MADTEIMSAVDGKTITGTDNIDLKGEFITGGLRSAGNGNTVTAEVQENAIIVTFHKNLGNVKVTLADSTGDTVYEVTVNTSVQQQVFISLSGLPSGVYTITFSNSLGVMYGDFEI
jgi:hypothetical protein